jgi:hypothetical protein
MFLSFSAYQALKTEDISLIIFKTKEEDLLHIHELQENIDLHVTDKVGRSELSKEPNSIIDETTKTNIVRLNKEELVMVEPAFRHPIKIIFHGYIFPR